ncbi:hypothetical protein SASPL_136151 [Salvia splendens]|uniref:LisH domain-containing protein n=1 Tax=Salvia splendens TaxID=180675 RepID=A0A8X8ZG58_SALSN|nr:hypothetical protein SASPL_136151 [Salvia splendens]
MALLNPEDDSILIFSVALWLQNKGFSKVLKRFCTAAQIEGEDWKAKALNLNEIFTKYQEISTSACNDLKFQLIKAVLSLCPEELLADVAEKTANGSTAEEIKGKKKNKKSKTDTSVNESEETLEDTAVAEKLNKSHENGNDDESGKASKKSNAEDQSTKKPKEKKKKSKLASQSLDADVPEVKQEALSSENTEATEDGTDESKKAFKKKKRMLPAETEKKSANGHAFEQAKTDAFERDMMTVSANSNEMGESSQKKSASKQPKSSELETFTLFSCLLDLVVSYAFSFVFSWMLMYWLSSSKSRAFQRVKIDEVEFVDDRLQDNSYWAKDGAETGYGAKAQVKGRCGFVSIEHLSTRIAVKVKDKGRIWMGFGIDLRMRSMGKV